MDVELGGFLSQNSTYDYDDDYEYKEESERRGSEAVLIPLLYSAGLIVGLLGNALLLVVLTLKRRWWSAADTVILHLSVADILLLATLPLWATQAARPDGWCFGNALCKISGAVFHMNFYCGIFLLAGVSVDRCLSVVHSTQLHLLNKPLLVHVSCVCVWCISLLLTIPDWVFLIAETVASQEKTLCDYNYSGSGTNWQLLSRVCHLSLGFLLPATALAACCSRILLRLQQRSGRLLKQSAGVVIVPLAVVFLLCWMPYNITLIVDTFSYTSKEPHGAKTENSSLKRALMVTSGLGCVHACVRPLLYLGLCGNFRKQTLALLRCAPVEFRGSLWDLSVAEEVQPEQSHEQEKLKPMRSVECPLSADEHTQKSPAEI
ncbi:C-X-C chemokine receptor type 3-like [Solea solea]|uniref:C-X-C chemokine receptor type 3-like n=1 Tax=Solea solea TaxID=90069 RepID=UPI00272D851F|nr:C-X-C chemokine receptor type 3-like [Solea solea]